MNTKQALKTLHTLAALCGVLALTHPFPAQAQSIASIDKPATPARANGDDALWNDRFGPPGIAASRWDGNRWYALGTGTGMYTDRVHQIATAGTIVYAGGSFKSMGSVTVNGIVQWNGTAWATVGMSLHSV